ncbi:fructosamine kinase family protein [Runella slithyformis]|uniref:Fructosamine/Ketosamine-3-kinase n=1 Tax=Runella slithyformis (strain ATCC 29530 / DSM 19594 / LMG 11500 / NCIMB 11436 / LSU 4) TaxID=761193 RepID=A0A7U3ZR54_RUNSL|nr:fructosamine kinase family protein [Runella slithyformis]AEI51840.1 Fructosamine/Ketosamine-3-kinase [Runella slithyformis DSM 19594]
MWLGNDQYQFFESILFETLGYSTEVIEVRFVSGGSINTAARVLTPEGTFFVKFNHAEKEDMFEKEVRGLRILRSTKTIHIPQVYGYGKNGGKAYLIQEFVENGGQHPAFWRTFGQSLAKLHAHTHHSFGLDFDNYIGSLEQTNSLNENGIDFFIESRLRPQAGLALYNSLIDYKLYSRMERFFPLLAGLLPNERPALLHGDLWSGNFLINEQGLPSLVDPAPYYGLREAELAFTHLFGGFDDEFYESYADVFPLEPQLEARIPIYNLYPLFVHVNLFGKSYLPPIERLVRRYLGA